MTIYFCEDTMFDFVGKRTNSAWLKLVVESEIRKMGDVSIVFCSDGYLLDMNKKYLNHDFYTDIITFDYCEDDVVSGDLFISIDSVRQNAQEFNTDFDEELRRVMVHGILHLIGYDDQTEQEKAIMRRKEDYYLSLREQM